MCVAGAQAAGDGAAAGAPLLTPFAEGRRLGVGDSGPVVQPVRVPAQPQLLAAVPARGEAYAVGLSGAPSSLPGYDASGWNAARQVGAQEVFLHWDAQHGWQSQGPPMENGTAHNPVQVSALSVAADGDGWAAGAEPDNPSGHTQVMYHKPPGSSTWQVVENPIGGTTPLSAAVSTISVASDAAGSFGSAVLAGGGVLELQPGGTWQADRTGVDDTVVRVATVSRTSALAVGGAAAQHFQSACVDNPNPQACLPSLQQYLLSTAGGRDQPDVFVRTAAGWQYMQVPAPPHGAAALSLWADGSGAWIGGATQATPWLLHLTYGSGGPAATGTAGTSYCAPANGPCDHAFPADSGAIYDVQQVGGDAFAAGASGELFHLHRGSWAQEPTTVGPVGAVAFTSPGDGWLARLDSYYGIGVGYDPPVLGHYTLAPDAPGLRDWPDPHLARLTAVAEDPAGSGVAMAGGDGVIMRLDPGSGLWSPMAVPPGLGTVRAISWPRHDQAWAVAGTSILRFDGAAWHTVPVQGDAGTGPLYGIAVGTAAVQPPPAAAAPPAPPPAADPGSRPPALVAWGDNQSGELGDGTDVGRSTPEVVAGVDGAVMAEGNVDSEEPATHTQVANFTVALVCSRPTSCARDGRVLQWGRLLGAGQLTRPQAVPGLAGHAIVALAAGGDHVLALDSGGAVWAWGDDAEGQLGTGPGGGATAIPQRLSLSGIVGIAAGARHSLAVDGNGTVWCWGDNGAGQCGQPTIQSTVSTPTPVAGVAGAVQVAAGTEFSLARTAGGAVLGWGDDTWDQLGRDSGDPIVSTGLASNVPQQVPGVTASTVVAGAEFAAAVDAASGEVVTWGRNQGGQLGTGSGAGQALAHTVPGLHGIRALAAAGEHAMALDGGAHAYGWGLNADGEVSSAGRRVVGTPVPLPGLDGARAIGAGQQSSYAVVPAPAQGQGLQAAAPPPPSLSGPFLGYAVGAHGVTVRFDGSAWTVDAQSAQLTDQALHAVAVTGRDAVAAGSDGAVLVDDGSGWKPASIPDAALDFVVYDGGQHHLSPPDLTAAQALPDGTVLLAGERGTLLQRRPGDAATAFSLAPLPPLEGWVHALAARRDGGSALHLAVAVGADPNVEADQTGRPEDTTTLTGGVLVGDAGGWRDAEDAEAVQDGTGTEQSSAAPRPADVEALALDPAGLLGWAVGTGGTTWRLALEGTPPPSPMTVAAELEAGPGLSFAYVAETGCLQAVCRHQLGWSSRGDVVTTDALRAAQSLAQRGELALVTLGGDLRQPGGGNADDLAALRPLLDSLSVPVFGAVGSRDLVRGSAGAWEQAFADRPAPWGGGHAPAGVAPVAWLPGAVHHAGADTHYAFDVLDGATARLRVVVLDTSTLPLAANDRGQNPTESQVGWLLATLLDARSRGVPAVVVMNRLAVSTPSSGTGDAGVDAALRAAGAAGVLAAGMPANQQLSSGGVPVGVFGGGGGRFLAAGQSGGDAVPGVDTLHGYYFSWQLVTLAPGASAVRIRSIPVLADMAIDAPSGRAVAAGSAVSFTGLGHTPPAARFQAGGTLDSEYDPATLAFPFPRHCGSVTPGGGTGCSPAGVAIPDYRFGSDDQTALVPVQEDPARPGHPLHDAAGRALPDPTGTSGLFCATRASERTVTLSAGSVAAQLPVTVTAGTARAGSDCARIAPLPVARVAHLAAALPQPPHPPAPAAAPGVPLPLHEHAPQPPQVGAAAPPPVNPIPAPPGGAPGGEAAGERQREEEVEAAREDAAMTALPGDAGGGWAAGLAAGMGAVLVGLAFGGGAARRRGRGAPAWVGEPPRTWRRR